MKSIFEIPEVDLDPACMERIARAYSQLQTMEKKLEPVRAKTADFNSRRAAAAEKVKTARERWMRPKGLCSCASSSRGMQTGRH